MQKSRFRRPTGLRPATSSTCALVLAVLLAATAGAQEHRGEEHGAPHDAAGHHEHDEHGRHEFHRHHFSVFLGVTDGEIEREAEAGAESEHGAVVFEDQTAFSVGLDYEYRLSERWGVGVLIDYAGKDFRSWVAGVPLVFHATDRLKLLVAPGLEDKETEDNEFLVRVGLMVDFEVGAFTIAPAFNVDFVDDEEILVYGFNIGKGF